MLLAMAEEIQPTKDTATTMVAWLAPPFKELQNRVIHMAYDYQKTINNKQLLVDNKTKGKHLKSSYMQTCTHTRNTEGILPKAFNFSKPPSTYVPSLRTHFEDLHKEFLSGCFNQLLTHMDTEIQSCSTHLEKQSMIMKEFIGAVKKAVETQKTADPAHSDQWDQEGTAILKLANTNWDVWKKQGQEKAMKEKEEHSHKSQMALLKRKNDDMNDLVNYCSTLHAPFNAHTFSGETHLQKELLEASTETKTKKKLRRRTHSTLNSIDKLQKQLSSLDFLTIQNMMKHGVADTQVHNITNLQIPMEQLNSLAYGLKFIPTPKPSKITITNAITQFTRTIRLKWYFKDEKPKPVPQWHIATGWHPDAYQSHPFLEQIIAKLKLQLLNETETQFSRNWTSKQNKQLLQLLSDDKTVVITADKNLGYVICST